MPSAGATLSGLPAVLHEACAMAIHARETNQSVGASPQFFGAATSPEHTRDPPRHSRAVIFTGDFSIFRGKSATKKTKKNAFSL
jgi:hypothetical protein